MTSTQGRIPLPVFKGRAPQPMQVYDARSGGFKNIFLDRETGTFKEVYQPGHHEVRYSEHKARTLLIAPRTHGIKSSAGGVDKVDPRARTAPTSSFNRPVWAAAGGDFVGAGNRTSLYLRNSDAFDRTRGTSLHGTRGLGPSGDLPPVLMARANANHWDARSTARPVTQKNAAGCQEGTVHLKHLFQSQTLGRWR